jgi:hypothetical protein
MKCRVPVLLVVLTLLLTPVAYGFREFFSADGPMALSGALPNELRGLLNNDARVSGTLGDFDTWTNYAGDAPKLNAFLKEYAKVPEVGLQVVLHPGRTKRKVGGTKRTVHVDWTMHIAENYSIRPNAAAFKGKKGLTTVDIWIGGQVELDKLQVPLNIDLISGGEIERFIKKHEERQQKAEGAGAERSNTQ